MVQIEVQQGIMVKKDLVSYVNGLDHEIELFPQSLLSNCNFSIASLLYFICRCISIHKIFVLFNIIHYINVH